MRTRKGLGQNDLAERAGIGPSTLSRYENDKRTYQFDGLIKLADALDTSTDYLLGRTKVSVPVYRYISEKKSPDGSTPFLEAYSGLDPEDQNLMRERVLTLYEVRSRDKMKEKRRQEAEAASESRKTKNRNKAKDRRRRGRGPRKV